MSMTKENLIYMLTQIVNFFALNFQGVGGKVPPSPPHPVASFFLRSNNKKEI